MIPTQQDNRPTAELDRPRSHSFSVLRGMLAVAGLTCLVVTAAGAACQTARAATFLPKDGAPTLAPRGGGCHVDVFLAGETVELAHPHRVVGELEAHRTQEQMREGGEGAVEALKAAACEAGVFVILDIKAFPGGTIDGGATYVGKAAVLLDDKGEILGEEKPVDAAPVAATTAEPTDAGPEPAAVDAGGESAKTSSGE